MHKHEAHALCKQHLHRYVLVQLTNGSQYDGIVAHVDDEYVHLAVPVTEAASREMRPFGYPYPYFPGAYPFYPIRRFSPLALPLAGLLALSLLPYY